MFWNQESVGGIFSRHQIHNAPCRHHCEPLSHVSVGAKGVRWDQKEDPPPTFLRKNVSGLLATGQFRQAFFFTVVAGTSVFQRIKGSERWVSLSWAQALGGRRGGAFWGLEHQIWGYLAWGQGRCRSTASRTHTHTHTQTHTHRDQLRTT